MRIWSYHSCIFLSAETLCGGTITDPNDVETGNAGAPVACCQVKLVDEKEMGYTHLDKPKPRGQIMIGGPNVSVGYYEQDKLTAEAYFTDSDGVRYFATGQAQAAHGDIDERCLARSFFERNCNLQGSLGKEWDLI